MARRGRDLPAQPDPGEALPGVPQPARHHEGPAHPRPHLPDLRLGRGRGAGARRHAGADGRQGRAGTDRVRDRRGRDRPAHQPGDRPGDRAVPERRGVEPVRRRQRDPGRAAGGEIPGDGAGGRPERAARLRPGPEGRRRDRARGAPVPARRRPDAGVGGVGLLPQGDRAPDMAGRRRCRRRHRDPAARRERAADGPGRLGGAAPDGTPGRPARRVVQRHGARRRRCAHRPAVLDRPADHQQGGDAPRRRHRPHPLQRRAGADRAHHPRTRRSRRRYRRAVPGSPAPQPSALPASRRRGAVRRPRRPGGHRQPSDLADLDAGRRLPARGGQRLPDRPGGRRDQLRQLRRPDREGTRVRPTGRQPDQGVQLPLRRRGRAPCRPGSPPSPTSVPASTAPTRSPSRTRCAGPRSSSRSATVP